MKRKRQAKTTSKSKSRNLAPLPAKQPFIEHLHELRRRLFIVAVSVGIWSSLAYGVEHHIVDWLVAPARGEKFIYTSVGGGIDFLFRVCMYTGVLFSIPVILYQMLRYIQPLIKRTSLSFIVVCSLISAVLAIGGILFGYYLGLPSALGFLLHQFNGQNIGALITIQSYLSFVMLYLFGSSLLFQVPLIIYIINRIKPIKPRSLLKYERWVILISFIIGAMINPSPRIYDMTILAVPMIMSYQIGVILVWWTNRKPRRYDQLKVLFDQDAARRAEREARSNAARHLPVAALKIKKQPLKPNAVSAVATHHSFGTVKQVYAATSQQSRPSQVYHTAVNPPAGRSQKYVNGFIDFRPPPSYIRNTQLN